VRYKTNTEPQSILQKKIEPSKASHVPAAIQTILVTTVEFFNENIDDDTIKP
jgi:hypothetical protein